MLLSLDISTSCTGYCVFDKNELKEIGYISLKKHKGLYDKSNHVKEKLIEIKSRFVITDIAVEENLQSFRPGLSSAKTLMILAQFNGVTRWICYELFNIEPISINVNSARKSVGLRIDRKSKKKTKEQVYEWVAKEDPSIVWPTKVLKSGRNKGQVRIIEENFDMADAYVIGRAFMVI